MTDLTEVRSRAWRTRRAKYGKVGHNSSYARPTTRCGACQSMADLIVRLHNEGTLSEGQASKAMGIGRIELRIAAQAHPSFT